MVDLVNEIKRSIDERSKTAKRKICHRIMQTGVGATRNLRFSLCMIAQLTGLIYKIFSGIRMTLLLNKCYWYQVVSTMIRNPLQNISVTYVLLFKK